MLPGKHKIRSFPSTVNKNKELLGFRHIRAIRITEKQPLLQFLTFPKLTKRSHEVRPLNASSNETRAIQDQNCTFQIVSRASMPYCTLTQAKFYLPVQYERMETEQHVIGKFTFLVFVRDQFSPTASCPQTPQLVDTKSRYK